ncbi:MAG: M56 family metallopeptidase, partial [Armatimonadetes bacterium]|nr:M56 family metallopeptidase [Armatimonadota bacterium]
MKNWLWENPSLRTLAWTLLHLLWQGALIAGLLAVGLALMRKRSAQARYLASCATLLLIAIAPAGTYRYLTASEGISSANALPTMTLTTTNSVSLIHLLTPYLPLLTLLWGIGVTFLSLRLLFGWVGIYRLGQLKTTEVSTSIRDRANELARQHGITCRVEVLASGIAEVPMTFGLARRVILLPVSALLGLSPTILEAIITHELAHIRRHDYLVNLIQTAIETLFFYHPAVWWISRQIRNE